MSVKKYYSNDSRIRTLPLELIERFILRDGVVYVLHCVIHKKDYSELMDDVIRKSKCKGLKK
jgi:hypothetical protein